MAVKGASQRRKLTEQERNTRIAQLVCDGKNYVEVGKEFGLTSARISQLMSRFRAEWSARQQVAVADHIQIELAKLSETFQQADDTYRRSLEDARKVVTSRSENGESQTETIEGQAGDTAALGIKLRCIEMSLKLLNAFPKEENQTNVVINQWDWEKMSQPIPFVEAVEATPSSEVEARIESELKSETPPSNNGNGHA